MASILREFSKPLCGFALTGFIGHMLLVCCMAMTAESKASNIDSSAAPACHQPSASITAENDIDHHTSSVHAPGQSESDVNSHCPSDSKNCCDHAPSFPYASNDVRSTVQKTDGFLVTVGAWLSTTPIISRDLANFNIPPPTETLRGHRHTRLYLSFCSFLE